MFLDVMQSYDFNEDNIFCHDVPFSSVTCAHEHSATSSVSGKLLIFDVPYNNSAGVSSGFTDWLQEQTCPYRLVSRKREQRSVRESMCAM